jgi:transcriptional regulator with XRE-family HTH domain
MFVVHRAALIEFMRAVPINARDLATASGVSATLISQMRTGQRPTASENSLKAIAGVLDCTVADLGTDVDLLTDFLSHLALVRHPIDWAKSPRRLVAYP